MAQVLPDLTSFGPWTSPYGANGQITMTVHNYRSRKVNETLNGVNPSSLFRDLRSAKYGPNLCQIWQVFGPWARQMGKWPWQFTTTGLDNSTEPRIEKIRQAVWQPPARPPGPWRQYPSSPEGWGVKSHNCDCQITTIHLVEMFLFGTVSTHNWSIILVISQAIQPTIHESWNYW